MKQILLFAVLCTSIISFAQENKTPDIYSYPADFGQNKKMVLYVIVLPEEGQALMVESTLAKEYNMDVRNTIKKYYKGESRFVLAYEYAEFAEKNESSRYAFVLSKIDTDTKSPSAVQLYDRSTNTYYYGNKKIKNKIKAELKTEIKRLEKIRKKNQK